MENPNDHIEDLMIRLFENDLDSTGRKELEDWIALSPEHQKQFYDEQEIWFSVQDERLQSKYDKEKAFELFRKRVAATSHVNPHRLLKRWMKYAAGLVILGILVSAAFFYGRNKMTAQFAEVVIESPRGGLSKINLPDGTSVWLNSNSKIIYSQGYGITDRKVRLVGEGYFNVRKNVKLPFSIQSGELLIRDLGTQFNVRNYPSDPAMEILLKEGKVAFTDLKNTQKEYYLKPNQKAVIAKSTGKVSLQNYDASEADQWTNGELVFSGQPMAYLIQTLERNYNVKIDVTNNNVWKCHFYGDFMKQDQSLDEVLKTLSLTGKFKYKIQRNRVILY